MSPDLSFLANPLVAGAFWLGATLGAYFAAKTLYRRLPRWYFSPLAVAPALLLALAVPLGVRYRDYMGGARWLLLMLGPATVAFAAPIYEQRALIRRCWPALLAGVVAGSAAAIASAWAMASLVGLSGDLRLSLLPRSMSTPFAMSVSADIGGAPDLTAVFVMITGVCGAALGEAMLNFMPLRTGLARGAMFGMGAHGAGTARAREIGAEEGSVAGLTMVLAGLFNVLAAPFLAFVLRAAS